MKEKRIEKERYVKSKIEMSKMKRTRERKGKKERKQLKKYEAQENRIKR